MFALFDGRADGDVHVYTHYTDLAAARTRPPTGCCCPLSPPPRKSYEGRTRSVCANIESPHVSRISLSCVNTRSADALGGCTSTTRRSATFQYVRWPAPRPSATAARMPTLAYTAQALRAPFYHINSEPHLALRGAETRALEACRAARDGGGQKWGDCPRRCRHPLRAAYATPPVRCPFLSFPFERARMLSPRLRTRRWAAAAAASAVLAGGGLDDTPPGSTRTGGGVDRLMIEQPPPPARG